MSSPRLSETEAIHEAISKHAQLEQLEIQIECSIRFPLLFDEVRRREFKVVFRKGMACKRTETGLVLFDTTQMEGKDGVGEAIFVMDRFGNIFAGPYSRGEFHHSSFLAGGWSMAAGVIGVDQGQRSSPSAQIAATTSPANSR